MTLSWWEVFLVVIVLVVCGWAIGACWAFDHVKRRRPW